jgi:hypothetical protein
MARLESDVTYIKSSVDDIKNVLREHMDEETKRFDRLDERYAAKKVEVIVYGVITIILTAVISAGLYLVIRS